MGVYHKRILAGTLIMLGILGVGLGAYKFAYVPYQAAETYLQRLTPQLGIVRADIKHVVDTTQSPLFNNPDISHDERLATISRIETTLEKSEQQLDELAGSQPQQDSSQPDVFNVATRATATQRQLPDSVAQTQEVIVHYKSLLQYLQEREKLDTELKLFFDEFNTIADYDELAGLAPVFWQRRDTISDLLLRLQSLSVPPGLERSHASAVQTYTISRDGFDSFASALNVPTDDGILYGARQLEFTTAQHEADRAGLYDFVATLPVIEDIESLEEKFADY